MSTYASNPLRVDDRFEASVNLPRAFHVRLPGYAPTPLLDQRDLAEKLGVGRLWVKDESARLGLPSFEILGASWALYRSLLDRLGRRPARWETLAELSPSFDSLRPVRVVAVSDDGFGLAAARAARLFDLDAITFVPAGMAPERLAAVEAEGSTLVAIDGGYDDALAAASAQVRDDDIVLSDSSWPGFDDVPRWVTDGYATVFEEVDDELASREAATPDLVVVPLGTGALAAAAAVSLRTEAASAGLHIVGVEPQAAACFSESVLAGRRTALPGPAPSVMTSLSRGLPSPLAFGPVSTTFDGFVALDDDEARAAADQLVAHGVQTTPSGAAALGGLAALFADPPPGWELGRSTSVLVVNTEGPMRVDRS